MTQNTEIHTFTLPNKLILKAIIKKISIEISEDEVKSELVKLNFTKK